MKFGIVFTSDYEIHGNGEGSPMKLMVEPTAQMLSQFDEFGAKLTIMADVGEIIRFGRHKDETGKDEFFYDEIVRQLQLAVSSGHDVQLHLHPSYFSAIYNNGKWDQNWTEYSIADLSFDRLIELVRIGKRFLEDSLKPVNPDYKCFCFRAANWSMQPSKNIVKALIDNDIIIDTSVFKYGKRTGRVTFDYSHAHHDAIPWTLSENDVCDYDPNGKMLEFPIYSENRAITAFISPNRIFRVISEKFHPDQKYIPDNIPDDNLQPNNDKKNDSSLVNKVISTLTHKHAWKMDFNQCTGKQLIAGLKRVEAKYKDQDKVVPVVLIGHSKLFTQLNEKQLRPFLKYVKENPDKYFFATFSDFDTTSYGLKRRENAVK